MTDPQCKPGDIVNGHRLTEQPDGSLAWVLVGTDPQPNVGDVVNGHRLSEQADGSLAWHPVGGDMQPKKSRRGLWITASPIGAVLLLIVIFGCLNRGTAELAGDVTADSVASEGAEPSAEVDEEAPERPQSSSYSPIRSTATPSDQRCRAPWFGVAIASTT